MTEPRRKPGLFDLVIALVNDELWDFQFAAAETT
jgi:hypothetical protein